MIDNFKLEKMRYQNNSFSYMFVFLALILSLLAAFIGLNSIAPRAFTIFKVLYNIAILLVSFLAMEKAKRYSKAYSIVLIVLGAICLLRIIYGPIVLIKYGSIQQAIVDGTYTGDVTLEMCGNYLDKICRVNQTVDPSGNFVYSWISDGWLPHSPVFRGITMLVLLLGAGASFISAGVVGYIKSIRLSKYLDSLKQEG